MVGPSALVTTMFNVKQSSSWKTGSESCAEVLLLSFAWVC